MRIAIISDVHANLEAFQSVLTDIETVGVDKIFCLGDTIGYGPDPEASVTLLRERAIPSVIGNHEKAVIDFRFLRGFNPVARESLQKTIKMLSEDTLRFLGGLDTSIVAHGCRFVHGFPLDSPMTYLFQVSEAKLHRTFAKMPERCCFVGHTHLLECVEWDGDIAVTSELTRRTYRLNPDRGYIINVGSVGQPRDGDNNAKYSILDTDENCLEVRFVPYDIAAVAEKIIARGLPKSHALRLW